MFPLSCQKIFAYLNPVPPPPAPRSVHAVDRALGLHPYCGPG